MDDNPDAANSLALLLETLGHDVKADYDGPAALEAVATHHPEIVFLDLGMPGMSGYEVAVALRSSSTNAAIRLVALTGWGAADDRQRTLKAGFDCHLVKPVALKELQACLDSMTWPAEQVK